MSKLTETQRRQLLQMFKSLPYYGGRSKAKKLIPATNEERAARRLIARIDARREREADKASERYCDAKEKAREAIFFGDDLDAALAAIKHAREMAR